MCPSPGSLLSANAIVISYGCDPACISILPSALLNHASALEKPRPDACVPKRNGMLVLVTPFTPPPLTFTCTAASPYIPPATCTGTEICAGSSVDSIGPPLSSALFRMSGFSCRYLVQPATLLVTTPSGRVTVALRGISTVSISGSPMEFRTGSPFPLSTGMNLRVGLGPIVIYPHDDPPSPPGVITVGSENPKTSQPGASMAPNAGDTEKTSMPQPSRQPTTKRIHLDL